MAQVVFSREELMAEHSYAKPQIEAGYRLHGGFDAKGTYISPRTLHRWPAVEAWQAQLETRGFPVIDGGKVAFGPAAQVVRELLRACPGPFTARVLSGDDLAAAFRAAGLEPRRTLTPTWTEATPIL